MILQTLHIMDAVQRLAVTGVPALGVPPVEGLKRIYLDLCPKNFKRPSLLIQSVATRQQNVSHRLVRVQEELLLTVFDVTDAYSHTATTGLLAMRGQVLDLFRSGTLAVEDRVLGVKASAAGRNWDEAYVDLTVEYHDVVTEMEPEYPLMEHIDTTIHRKE